MKLRANQSRIPVQLRKDLVAGVKSSLKPGMDFNIVYGQLLSRLEKCDEPSMGEAKLLLQNPEALVTGHMERHAASLKAKENLKAQVVNANIPKNAANRERLVAETMAFVARFPTLTAAEVKAVTLLRQENENRDPRVIHTHEIASPDELADNLADTQPLEHSAGKPGARFSASCQLFMLKEGESLRHDPKCPTAGVPTLLEV